MDIFEFAAMIEETPVKSRVVEYVDQSDTAEGKRALVAVCLTDVLDDGVSMVYSFYEPNRSVDSIGTYIILDHVEIARQAGLPYVYLGYWVPGSRKMGYKANFSGLEVYKNSSWQAIGDPADHSSATHPLSVDPIAEQVARIALPEARPGKP